VHEAIADCALAIGKPGGGLAESAGVAHAHRDNEFRNIADHLFLPGYSHPRLTALIFLQLLFFSASSRLRGEITSAVPAGYSLVVAALWL
jgi:hypothetical protein